MKPSLSKMFNAEITTFQKVIIAAVFLIFVIWLGAYFLNMVGVAHWAHLPIYLTRLIVVVCICMYISLSIARDWR